jgi:hypothetical protein
MSVPAKPGKKDGDSTLPEPKSISDLRGAQLMRRVGVAGLLLLLTVGALGYLGSRTSVAVADANGYELRVTYPAVTRPGLPVRWEIEVDHAGGFSDPIRIAFSFAYIHLFDISNTEPDATSATATGVDLVYVFDPPPGSTFRVSMDGNAEPSEHAPFTTTTSVLVGDSPVVSVDYRTVMVP